MAKGEERGVAIPQLGEAGAHGEALEGLFVVGESLEGPGAVLAPPHPLYGGSMDSPVVSELAFACSRAGLASLRFNWRGVGASAGSASGELSDAVADYAAALLQLGRSCGGPLVAAGSSFGAVAALRAAAEQPRVRRLLLVAPPPALLDERLLASTSRDLLILAGAHDALAPAAALEALARRLPCARVALVPEADHFFGAGLADLGREAFAWLGGDAH
jgi:hypothetical protein